MSETPYASKRIEKALSMLIMAKRILDAWPKDQVAPNSDQVAAETAAKLIEQAMKQLSCESFDN